MTCNSTAKKTDIEGNPQNTAIAYPNADTGTVPTSGSRRSTRLKNASSNFSETHGKSPPNPEPAPIVTPKKRKNSNSAAKKTSNNSAKKTDIEGNPPKKTRKSRKKQPKNNLSQSLLPGASPPVPPPSNFATIDLTQDDDKQHQQTCMRQQLLPGASIPVGDTRLPCEKEAAERGIPKAKLFVPFAEPGQLLLDDLLQPVSGRAGSASKPRAGSASKPRAGSASKPPICDMVPAGDPISPAKLFPDHSSSGQQRLEDVLPRKESRLITGHLLLGHPPAGTSLDTSLTVTPDDQFQDDQFQDAVE
jgi:hypothetical protein